LLDCLRGPFDQVLGFLETQTGDLADHLDDFDLVGPEALEDDRELGLLGGLGRLAAARAAAAGSDDHAARGGLDLVNLLEISAQLDRLRDGQSGNLVAEVCDIGRKFRHCSLSFLSEKPVCLRVLPEAGSACVIAKANVRPRKAM